MFYVAQPCFCCKLCLTFDLLAAGWSCWKRVKPKSRRVCLTCTFWKWLRTSSCCRDASWESSRSAASQQDKNEHARRRRLRHLYVWRGGGASVRLCFPPEEEATSAGDRPDISERTKSKLKESPDSNGEEERVRSSATVLLITAAACRDRQTEWLPWHSSWSEALWPGLVGQRRLCYCCYTLIKLFTHNNVSCVVL